MNNSQKFEELKPEIKDFISNKKLEGLPAADIKKEMSKPKKENGFGVSLRTAQRWYLILNDPEVGSFETIQNKKEVNRIGSSFLLDNLERLIRQDLYNNGWSNWTGILYNNENQLELFDTTKYQKYDRFGRILKHFADDFHEGKT